MGTNDPMTTETAAMFMRQRDEALVAWGRLRGALMDAVQAWETEFGYSDEPVWVINARAALAEGEDRWAR